VLFLKCNQMLERKKKSNSRYQLAILKKNIFFTFKVYSHASHSHTQELPSELETLHSDSPLAPCMSHCYMWHSVTHSYFSKAADSPSLLRLCFGVDVTCFKPETNSINKHNILPLTKLL